jgi:hypothetical protein
VVHLRRLYVAQSELLRRMIRTSSTWKAQPKQKFCLRWMMPLAGSLIRVLRTTELHSERSSGRIRLETWIPYASETRNTVQSSAPAPYSLTFRVAPRSCSTMFGTSRSSHNRSFRWDNSTKLFFEPTSRQEGEFRWTAVQS